MYACKIKLLIPLTYTCSGTLLDGLYSVPVWAVSFSPSEPQACVMLWECFYIGFLATEGDVLKYLAEMVFLYSKSPTYECVLF